MSTTTALNAFVQQMVLQNERWQLMTNLPTNGNYLAAGDATRAHFRSSLIIHWSPIISSSSSFGTFFAVRFFRKQFAEFRNQRFCYGLVSNIRNVVRTDRSRQKVFWVKFRADTRTSAKDSDWRFEVFEVRVMANFSKFRSKWTWIKKNREIGGWTASWQGRTLLIFTTRLQCSPAAKKFAQKKKGTRTDSVCKCTLLPTCLVQSEFEEVHVMAKLQI